jgi:hypothetical protein
VSKTVETTDAPKEEEKAAVEVTATAGAESSSEDEEIFGLSNELKMKTLSTKAR